VPSARYSSDWVASPLDGIFENIEVEGLRRLTTASKADATGIKPALMLYGENIRQHLTPPPHGYRISALALAQVIGEHLVLFAQAAIRPSLKSVAFIAIFSSVSLLLFAATSKARMSTY
jgi:hypothetical protein